MVASGRKSTASRAPFESAAEGWSECGRLEQAALVAGPVEAATCATAEVQPKSAAEQTRRGERRERGLRGCLLCWGLEVSQGNGGGGAETGQLHGIREASALDVDGKRVKELRFSAKRCAPSEEAARAIAAAV